jgi:hypothetical protein
VSETKWPVEVLPRKGLRQPGEVLADLLEPEEADPAKRRELAKRVIDHVEKEHLNSPSLSVREGSEPGKTWFVVNVGGRAEFGGAASARGFTAPTLTLALEEVIKA